MVASYDIWREQPPQEGPLLSRRRLGALLIQVALITLLVWWIPPFGGSRTSARYSELLTGAFFGNQLLPASAEGVVAPARDQIAVVLLDEITLRCLGASWPPPYQLHADILNRIKQYGPKALFLDFTFDVPRDRLKSGPSDDTFESLIEELRADPPPLGYFMAAGAQSCGVWEALKGEHRKQIAEVAYCPLARGVHEDFLAAKVTPVQARQGADYDELGDYPLWLEADAVPRDRFLRRHVLEGIFKPGQPAVEELLCRIEGAAARWSAAAAIHKAMTGGNHRLLPTAKDAPRTMRVLWRSEPAMPPPEPPPFCPGALPAGLFEAVKRNGGVWPPAAGGLDGGAASEAGGQARPDPCEVPRGFSAVWALFRKGLSGVQQDCPHFSTVHASTLLYGEEGTQERVRGMLEGRVVFYGGDIDAIRDATFSPAHGFIPGVYLHATALENLLVLGTDYKSSDQRVAVAGHDLVKAGNLLGWGVAALLAILGAVEGGLRDRARRLRHRLALTAAWWAVVPALVAAVAWLGFSRLGLGVVDVIGLATAGLAGPPIATFFYDTFTTLWHRSRRAWSTTKGDYYP